MTVKRFSQYGCINHTDHELHCGFRLCVQPETHFVEMYVCPTISSWCYYCKFNSPPPPKEGVSCLSGNKPWPADLWEQMGKMCEVRER